MSIYRLKQEGTISVGPDITIENVISQPFFFFIKGDIPWLAAEEVK